MATDLDSINGEQSEPDHLQHERLHAANGFVQRDNKDFGQVGRQIRH